MLGVQTMKKMNYNAVLKNVIEKYIVNGGITLQVKYNGKIGDTELIDLDGRDAWAVGIDGNEVVVDCCDGYITPVEIARYIKSKKAVLDHPDRAFGMWYDIDSNRVCIDVVTLIPGRLMAKAVGSMMHQKSIYNLKTGELLECSEVI